MNTKIAMLAVFLSILLAEAVPKNREESQGYRQKKKCFEVTTSQSTTQQLTTQSTGTTTQSTTTVSTTTTMAPDTSFCRRREKLNSTSGSYLKTICQTDYSNNYAIGLNLCKTHGMNLVTMTDYENVNSVAKYFAGIYGGQVLIFMLNGFRNSSTSNWVLYSDMTTSIYDGFNWLNYTNAYPRVAQFKLNVDGTYVAWAVPITGSANLVCEFI